MFKIFILSMFAQWGYGTAMTSQVLEFKTKEQADEAYEYIPQSKKQEVNAFGMLTAHKLYAQGRKN